jgi:folate-binding protein YgfZ
MSKLAHLPDRAVLAVTGADRVSFLNGLVSNDVTLAAPGRAVWAALLTPQGKWLADFFILSEGEALLLDCAADQAGMIAQRLTRFRLRAQATIEPARLEVYAGWDMQSPPPGAIAAQDPRLAEAGWRVLAQAALSANATHDEWDAHRLGLGLPDGARDLEAEKTVLLEAGFDELNGISWTKGCYMGQELTARTRYRGLLKRRLLPVEPGAPLGPGLPAHGTPITAGGRDAGEMRSSRGTRGLAMLRLDCLAAPLLAGGMALAPRIPDWVKLPQPAGAPVFMANAEQPI